MKFRTQKEARMEEISLIVLLDAITAGLLFIIALIEKLLTTGYASNRKIYRSTKAGCYKPLYATGNEKVIKQ
jgi:hypothetical protein